MILYLDKKIRLPMFNIVRTTNNNITHFLLLLETKRSIYLIKILYKCVKKNPF